MTLWIAVALKVYVQSAAPYRMLPDDINRWYMSRNNAGGMVPFSAFASSHWEAVLRVWSAITAIPPLGSSVKPRRASAPVRRWTPWKSWCNSCPLALVCSGRPCLIRSGSPGAGSRALRFSLLVVFLCLAALV